MSKQGLSIIINYYNGQEYIGQLIQSVYTAIKKTYLKFEIILIDDASEKLIESSVLNQYTDIKYIRNPHNKGIAESRNIGLEHSKYDYIQWIDQDDWLSSDFYIDFSKKINHNYDLFIFNLYEVINHKKNKRFGLFFKFYLKYLNEVKLIKYGNVFKTMGHTIIRKKISPRFIKTSTQGSDDYFYYIELFKQSLRINFNNKPLFNYRYHEANYAKQTDLYRSSRECLEILSKKDNKFINYTKYLDNNHYRKGLSYFFGRVLQKLIRV